MDSGFEVVYSCKKVLCNEGGEETEKEWSQICSIDYSSYRL